MKMQVNKKKKQKQSLDIIKLFIYFKTYLFINFLKLLNIAYISQDLNEIEALRLFTLEIK